MANQCNEIDYGEQANLLSGTAQAAAQVNAYDTGTTITKVSRSAAAWYDRFVMEVMVAYEGK